MRVEFVFQEVSPPLSVRPRCAVHWKALAVDIDAHSCLSLSQKPPRPGLDSGLPSEPPGLGLVAVVLLPAPARGPGLQWGLEEGREMGSPWSRMAFLSLMVLLPVIPGSPGSALAPSREVSSE